LPEALHQARKQEARAFHEHSEHEDAAPAVAVDPRAEQRDDHCGDADLESANQRKRAA